MTDEINTATTLHHLQAKFDRLETVSKELEEKLSKQNENMERLLMNLKLHNANAIVPIDESQEEGEDPEQSSLNQSSTKKNLTIEKSIHKLPLVHMLGMKRFATF